MYTFNYRNILETPKRVVLGEVTNSLDVSPTANLKLLTNVALQCAYQRKEKSLQILCDRFLELYPLNERCVNNEIHLDATAQRLGVEKRRIYDIINILEALQCATHRKKNTYMWHGASKLNDFLASLKAQGESMGIGLPYDDKKTPPKRRSLGNLAQRFLMMFLVKPPNTLINLEMAVAALIHHPQRSTTTPDAKDGLLKSKVRRLYDIANVLTSIGLIQRVSASQLKKPVFQYIGPRFVSLKRTPISTFLLTPDSTSNPHKSVIHTAPSRSKRKLIFASPSVSSKRMTPPYLNSPPPTPKLEKFEKCDEIFPLLEVAKMELDRLNNSS